MRPPTLSPRFAALLLLAGPLGTLPALAQTELPPLTATSSSSSRPTLERPPAYEIPSTTSTASARGSSRSTGAKSSGSGTIPDTSIFDGSGYPPEKRPEQGLIAQFEMPGQQQPQPSTLNVEGPGDQQGGGGEGPGGDGQMNSGGPDGMQVAGPQMPGINIPGLNIPGLPIPSMGGGAGMPGGPSLPSLPTLDMGDRGKEGQPGGQPGEGEEGQQGQGGQQGEGQPGDQQAVAGQPSDQKAPTLAGRQGRQLQKPDAVQIGDEGAKLAEADVPMAASDRALDGTNQGEDRMAVKSASGQQSANRSSGTERGIDIPSNL